MLGKSLEWPCVWLWVWLSECCLAALNHHSHWSNLFNPCCLTNTDTIASLLYVRKIVTARVVTDNSAIKCRMRVPEPALSVRNTPQNSDWKVTLTCTSCRHRLLVTSYQWRNCEIASCHVTSAKIWDCLFFQTLWPYLSNSTTTKSLIGNLCTYELTEALSTYTGMSYASEKGFVFSFCWSNRMRFRKYRAQMHLCEPLPVPFVGERERVGGDRTFIGITMIMMARLILRHPMTGYIIYTMLAQMSIN